MSARAFGVGTRNRPTWRSLTSGFAVAAIAATAVLAVVPAPAEARAGGADNAVPSDITMVQANIYTGLSIPRFQADVAKVLAIQPDFVTYNEVPFRSD